MSWSQRTLHSCAGSIPNPLCAALRWRFVRQMGESTVVVSDFGRAVKSCRLPDLHRSARKGRRSRHLSVGWPTGDDWTGWAAWVTTDSMLDLLSGKSIDETVSVRWQTMQLKRLACTTMSDWAHLAKHREPPQPTIYLPRSPQKLKHCRLCSARS